MNCLFILRVQKYDINNNFLIENEPAIDFRIKIPKYLIRVTFSIKSKYDLKALFRVKYHQVPNTNGESIHHFSAYVDELPYESEDVLFHQTAYRRLYI